MQPCCLFLFWLNLFPLFILSLPVSPPGNITLYADAFFGNNGICLTQETTCHPSSSPSHIGRALYVDPVPFRGNASFTSAFSFSIVPNPVCPFGDGIVFFIASRPDSFSFFNGYMGLPQLDDDFNSQDSSFFAVEFDTSFNPSLGDINGNHIGVDVNSVVSVASVDVLSKGFDLKSGKEITAWIEYGDSAKLVQIWLSYSSIKPPSPLLVAQIDLAKQFKEYMHVGFSASNGLGTSMHVVDHWQLKTFTTSIELGYCFMCFPEDSSNVTRPPKTVLGLKIGNVWVLLGSLVASVVVIIAIPVLCFVVVRKERSVGRRRRREESIVGMTNFPTRWSLAEIKSATLGFHRNRIVGEGASAVVYRGSVPSGGAIAVKRFDQSNRKSFTHNPFTTEFAALAGCLKHKNLVQLQGWCREGNELVLVYEFLANGSLDRLLHRNPDSSTFLSWSLRLKVVLGVASALTFLHEECQRQIIHRDVKSCNIMLDDEFNAKLGDFGLAEVYEHNSCSREATIPAGTIGYLAPEYVYCGVPTVKTDVYSFGVVLLEVATGKRPVDDNKTVLVDWVWDLWTKRKLLEAADWRLSGRFNSSEMERLLVVGLSCVHPNHEKRPTVREVARVLRGEAALPVLPLTRPTVRIKSNLCRDSEAILNLGGENSPVCEDAGWLTPRSHFSKV